jgi:hypothetical protein
MTEPLLTSTFAANKAASCVTQTADASPCDLIQFCFASRGRGFESHRLHQPLAEHSVRVVRVVTAVRPGHDD